MRPTRCLVFLLALSGLGWPFAAPAQVSVFDEPCVPELVSVLEGEFNAQADVSNGETFLIDDIPLFPSVTVRVDGVTFCGPPSCTNAAQLSLDPVPAGAAVAAHLPYLFVDLQTIRSETVLCFECLFPSNCGVISRNATLQSIPASVSATIELVVGPSGPELVAVPGTVNVQLSNFNLSLADSCLDTVVNIAGFFGLDVASLLEDGFGEEVDIALALISDALVLAETDPIRLCPELTPGIDASTVLMTGLDPNTYGGGVGHLFTVRAPIPVARLSHVSAAQRLASPVVVSLYDVTAGGTEADRLASVTLGTDRDGALVAAGIPSVEGGGPFDYYQHGQLILPVLLEPGRVYGIAAWDPVSGGTLDRPLGATVSHAVRYEQGLLGSGPQQAPGNGMLADADGAGEVATLGPGVEWVTAAPEPSGTAGGLAALVTLAGAWRVRRSRRRA